MEKLSALLENTAETIEDADAALVEKVAPSDKAAVQALSLIGEIGDLIFVVSLKLSAGRLCRTERNRYPLKKRRFCFRASLLFIRMSGMRAHSCPRASGP